MSWAAAAKTSMALLRTTTDLIPSSVSFIAAANFLPATSLKSVLLCSRKVAFDAARNLGSQDAITFRVEVNVLGQLERLQRGLDEAPEIIYLYAGFLHDFPGCCVIANLVSGNAANCSVRHWRCSCKN